VSVTAAPTLTVAGAPVPIAAAGAPGLVAIDALRINWGRGTVLEQPKAATATLTVLDRAAGLPFASRTDLIGQPIVLGWACSDGTSGTNFRGRVTDVVSTPLPGAKLGAGWRVALSCSSLEVDLANYVLPDATVWPAETFAARRARLAALLPAGAFAGGVVLPDRFALQLQTRTTPDTDLDTYPAAQQDVSGKDLLSLLRDLFAATSPLPMVYDVAGDRLTYAGRRLATFNQPLGMTLSAMLRASADHGGRYVAAGLSGVGLDAAGLAYSGGLEQQLDSRITGVAVSYLDQAAAYAQRSATATTTDSGQESVIGRRTWTIDTIHADAGKAAQLAGLYADVASSEARIPRLGQLGFTTKRTPFEDGVAVSILLAGNETGRTLFLRDSWLPQVRQRPIIGILGAVVSYSAGVWNVDLTPAPVMLNPLPLADRWAPVSIAASAVAGVRLRDMDPSVTFGDLAYIDIGAGYDTTTVLPYKGNPIP
jgi:hypothetical protein